MRSSFASIRANLSSSTSGAYTVDVIEDEDQDEATPETTEQLDRVTVRLRQVYLIVLICGAVLQAGILADMASHGQLRRDLEWQWARLKERWRQEQHYRKAAPWIIYQAESIVKEAAE